MKSACVFSWLLTLTNFHFAVAGDTMTTDYTDWRSIRIYNKTDPSIFFESLLPNSYTRQDELVDRESDEPVGRTWSYSYAAMCEQLKINPDFVPSGFYLDVPEWADNDNARLEFEGETESLNPFLWWTHSGALAMFDVPKIPLDQELQFAVEPSEHLSAEEWTELSKDLETEKWFLKPSTVKKAKASKYSTVLKLYNAENPESILEFEHAGPEKHVNVVRLCTALGIRPDGLKVDGQEKKILSGSNVQNDVGAYYIFRGMMGNAVWKKDGYAVSGLPLDTETNAEEDVLANIIKTKKRQSLGPISSLMGLQCPVAPLPDEILNIPVPDGCEGCTNHSGAECPADHENSCSDDSCSEHSEDSCEAFRNEFGLPESQLKWKNFPYLNAAANDAYHFIKYQTYPRRLQGEGKLMQKHRKQFRCNTRRRFKIRESDGVMLYTRTDSKKKKGAFTGPMQLRDLLHNTWLSLNVKMSMTYYNRIMHVTTMVRTKWRNG